MHNSLIRILEGESIPKKQRDAHDAAAYRIKGKRLVSLSRTRNPLTGSKELRVMVEHKNSGNKTILLTNSEVDGCIRMYYNKYKGSGARKLYRAISRIFTGVTERDIQAYINRIPKQQRVHPKFTNKLPLKPVQSSKVLNQVQIDLVDLSASPSTADTPGVTYKYILVVLDVFSRFCFLRPLRSKSSAEVAQRLIEIFSDTGPPVRIQSDQGTEFKGSVKMLMQAMGAQIIYSRPYHPQAQGKVCGCKCGLINFTHLNNFISD